MHRADRQLGVLPRLTRPRAADLVVVGTVTAREAWSSGASGWGGARRADFLNDLTDRRAFTVVIPATGRRRGDADAARWLPRATARCRYVAEWTATKLRWGLRADPAEKAALRRIAAGCADVAISVTRR